MSEFGSMFTTELPKWETRRGKVFYVRLLIMAIGAMMLHYTWSNDDKNIKAEIAATLMGAAIGAIATDAMLFLIPCKNLVKEVQE